jgi:hypothetical protein
MAQKVYLSRLIRVCVGTFERNTDGRYGGVVSRKCCVTAPWQAMNWPIFTPSSLFKDFNSRQLDSW